MDLALSPEMYLMITETSHSHNIISIVSNVVTPSTHHCTALPRIINWQTDIKLPIRFQGEFPHFIAPTCSNTISHQWSFVHSKEMNHGLTNSSCSIVVMMFIGE